MIEDEERTLDRLKDGQSLGAIAVYDVAIKGGLLTRLGKINYIVVATPEFVERYFCDGINTQTLMRVPGIAFDHKDNMHTRFIEQHFGLEEGQYPLHAVRSSEAFIDMTKHGAAYCLASQLQVSNELANA
ncbi:hypothetical protein [Shewanella algicola]|uniref:hypothetical protein n=1 Tax=Shewanella algicola TaxID=640633 RepID=UPI002494E203|nr:hypothetical protein [Shewanella algicola]